MKQIYPLLLVSFLLLSCGVRINYLGGSSSPTNDVDVYVDASAIKKPYTIMGKGYADYIGYTEAFGSLDKFQRKVIEVARKKGADAVLFQDYFLQNEGANISTISRTDSVDKGVITATSGTVTPTLTTGRNIFFLKYD